MRLPGIVAVAAVLLMMGCVATKKDVLLLRQDMTRLSVRQDSAMRDLQRQNRQLLDSIRATMTMTSAVRGSTTNQLTQFERSVNGLSELLKDIDSRLGRMEGRLTKLEEKPPVIINQVAQTQSGGGNPTQYYDAGIEDMNAGRTGTARGAFEALVTEFPNDPRAPMAQFHIGRTFVVEKAYAQAYAAFETVVQKWPTSETARLAIFSAGEAALENKDNARARTYYERVRKDYPNTDEARTAQQRIARIPRD